MNFVLIEALTFGLGRLVSAAEEMNANITLLTYNPEIYDFELSKINSENFECVKINTFDQEQVIKKCEEIKDLSGIINLTDTWTTMVTEVSEYFGFKSQNPISTKICRDKYLLRKTLSENNLTSATYDTINLAEDEVIESDLPLDYHYPLIVKDPNGTGSKNVWIVENREELKELLQLLKEQSELRTILLETYFKGTLFSAETITYQGETKLISISSRILSDVPDFMEKAISLPVNNSAGMLDGVDVWVEGILSSISYTDGFAHTEFIVSDTGFEVVEVNPRLGGVQIGEALCQSFDYNFYKSFIEMAMGQRPEVIDMDLNPIICTGQVFLYAKEVGTFSAIDARHLNKRTSTIYPCAVQGKEISVTNDQSACVAMLLTTSESTEFALLDALSESNKVKVIME